MSGCGKKRCEISRIVTTAEFYYDTGRAVQCEQLLGKILGIEPNCTWALRTLGLICVGSERYDEAIRIGRKAIGLDDPYGYYVIATAYEWQEQYEQAIEYCYKTIERLPNYHGVWDSLIWSYIKSGNIEGCYQAASEALSKFPGNEYIRYAVFHAYHQMEPDTKQETAVIGMMERAGHRLAQMYECKGRSAEKEGRFADAYRLYCRAYAEAPADQELRGRIEDLENRRPEIKRQNERGI